MKEKRRRRRRRRRTTERVEGFDRERERERDTFYALSEWDTARAYFIRKALAFRVECRSAFAECANYWNDSVHIVELRFNV
jgi:hypothetical protein